MAWPGRWSIKIDGVELNTLPTGGHYICEIPEIDNVPEQDQVVVAMDGDYPAFIRLQPREASWTLNLTMKPCDWPTYQTRLAYLKSLLSSGPHTLTVQVRGMDVEKSVTVIVCAMMVEAKSRAISVKLSVPKPVLV
jgi:hypothetical protein